MATSVPPATANASSVVSKTPDEIHQIQRDYVIWLIWSLAMPICFPLFIWGWSWRKGVADSFEVNFGGADMLVVAAMLFILVTQDIEKLPNAARYGGMTLRYEIFKWINIFLWVAYAFIKIDSFQISEAINGSNPSLSGALLQGKHDELYLYGIISLGVLAIVAGACVLTRTKIRELQLIY
jgi:hypothetical protein